MPPELEKLAPIAARNVLETAQASVNVDYSGIDEREKTITVDGFQIALNIVRPKGAAGTLPVFVFVHGGGWVLGDYPTHRRLVRDLVVESGYCAVFVNYTRTPDAVFPRQIDEIYAATKWVAEHGNEINVDGRNLAVVGNSVDRRHGNQGERTRRTHDQAANHDVADRRRRLRNRIVQTVRTRPLSHEATDAVDVRHVHCRPR
jgi:hypothetical protein